MYDIGLVSIKVVNTLSRHTQAATIAEEDDTSKSAWAFPAYGKRVGIVVDAGDAARADQPVEMTLPTGAGVTNQVLLVELTSGKQTPIPSQISSSHLLSFDRAGPHPCKERAAFPAVL